MKKAISIINILWLSILSAASSVTDGYEHHKIVLPPDAIAAEVSAAEELQTAIYAITDKRPEIVRSSEDIGVPGIYIGQSPWIGMATGVDDFAALAADEVIIKSYGTDLFITGGRPRGTFYGVNTLLEDYWQVRYWTPTETVYPPQTTLTLPELEYRYKPDFFYREAGFYDFCVNPRFSARRKMNGFWTRIPEEFGGCYKPLGFCHTFDLILPPDEYFASHPEYFAEVNGSRRKHESQLCLSNQEMRQVFIQRAIAWVKANPSELVSISQDDAGGMCTCDKCQTLTRDLGGQNSDLLLDFINEVAAALEREFPGITVSTLAYDWSLTPPAKVKARSNVLVQVCFSYKNYFQPVTAPVNAKCARELEQWAQMAERLGVWIYAANFSNFLTPFPNYYFSDEDLRFYRDHNVEHIFMNVDNGSSFGDFVPMRAYVLSKLCFDPSQSTRMLRDEFIDGYYGDAAQVIKEYFAVIKAEVDRHQSEEIACFDISTEKWLPFDVLMQLKTLMAEAVAAVQDEEEYVQRVRSAELPILFAFLLRPEIHDETIRQNYHITDAVNRDILRRVLDVVHSYPVCNYREQTDFKIFERMLKVAFDPELTIPEDKIPVQLKNIQKEKLAFFPAAEDVIYGRGAVTFVENDQQSTTGKIVRMTSEKSNWWVQIAIQTALPGRWRVYALIRSELAPGVSAAGKALTIGFYNKAIKESRTTNVNGEELAGDDYKLVELGEFIFNNAGYFFFEPMINDKVKNIYIDSIILVRQ